MRTFSRIRREGVLPRRWWDRGLIGERVGQPPARGRDSGPKEEGARKKGEVKKQMQWAKTRNQECSKYFWKMCAKTRDTTIFEKKKQRRRAVRPALDRMRTLSFTTPQKGEKRGRRKVKNYFKSPFIVLPIEY